MQRNKYISFICALVILLTLGLTNQIQASHLMGGNITYTYLGGSQYAVNLSLFRDCNGINLGNNESITATSPTCGTISIPMVNIGGPLVRTTLCPSETDRCDGFAGTWGVEEWIYRGTVTLPAGCGNNWTLSWTRCCRNSAITNLTSAGSFYVWAVLDNTISGGNSSPAFNNEPAIFLCAGQENRYNNGMTDAEGDDLVYSLVDCRTTGINNLVTYSGGATGVSPLFSNYMSINPETGEVVVFPTSAQVSVVCVLVEEYRNGQKIGEVIRDLQFTVTNCSNTLPILSGINGSADSSGTTGVYNTTACAGEQICFDVQAFDQQAVPSAPFQDLQVNWNYGINGASFVVDYSVPYPVGHFCWTPTPSDVGNNFFFIEVEDDACPFLGYNVYSYKIEVYADITVNIDPLDSIAAIGVSVGDTIQLNAVSNDPNATYAWSPAMGLSCTDCPSPILITSGSNASSIVTSYTCTVISDQGCSNSDDVDITVFAVSTDNIKELKRWDVFPNPITDHSILEYQLSQQSDVHIELYDLIGKRIAVIDNVRQNSGQYQYDLAQYLEGKAQGIYFLHMNINGKSATKKLMLK